MFLCLKQISSFPNVPVGEGVYHVGDVAVIQAMYDNNDLKKGDRNDPASRTFVEWNNSNPKRITKLDLLGNDLTGHLDVTGLTNLTELDCRWNNIQILDVSNNPRLTDFRYDKFTQVIGWKGN